MRAYRGALAATVLLISSLAAPTAAQVRLLSLVTGGTAGVYFPLGGAMAEIWNARVPGVRVASQSSGASVANIQFLARGDAHLALVQNDIAHYAYTGREMFAEAGSNRPQPITTLRGIAMLYPETIQIVSLRGKGITSVEHLRGRRVVVGAPGSGTEANARQILRVHDIFYRELRVDFVSFAAGIDQLRDGIVDAVFLTAGIPTAAVTDIAASRDIVIVPVGDDALQALRARWPFYTRQVIPPGTYRGVTAPVPTVAVMAMLVARADLPDDLVYNLTKALWENLDRVRAAHARGRDLELAKALDGMPLPVHPGAERYYRERGVRGK
ncbi:MAG: TAXI family TRAP transporter solute-binding subunit [Armatimonadota bacterium]|nr:TAXI family TRAP transporter solute-binding subunit [Armatimonadota bacterium]MDR7486350.1 TAXI family TRAP transporter solute-binding subunit [Armatimonadota bacterium]MDR7536757.1 TAXI family TRAP transporter solute-binding subunit [Armatimonadota bacterium]